MPANTKKNAPTAAPALPRFTPVENKFASAVSRNARLASLLPADEIGPLVAAHNRAQKLADQAQALRAEVVDPAVELHAAVENGTDVDIATFVAKVTEVRAAQAGQEEALRVLSALPARYKAEIARAIEDAEDDLLTGLGTQLDEVLDEAEVVLKDLGGATDAESALLADKGAAYRRWRELADAYSEIRTAHRALILASPSSAQSTNSPDLAKAMFGNVEEFMPKRLSEGVRYGGLIKPDTPPVDLLNIGSRDHFTFVVKNRAALRPRVGNGESTVSMSLDAGVEFAPRRLSPRYEYTMREIRNAAANRVAEERENYR